MNEGQIEDFEKFVKEHFPRGALLVGFMPDGSLHTFHIGNDEDAEAMYDWLAEMIRQEVKDLGEEDW